MNKVGCLHTLVVAGVLFATRAVAQTGATSGTGPSVAATHTQAIISYTAPNEQPCQIDVREKGATEPVNDVNSAVFAASEVDSRPGSVSAGTRRIFVVGKRAAERGSDGRYHSRALQADTDHTYQVKCAGNVLAEGAFRTRNIPLGVSYNDPLPSDPERPGEYAWPGLYAKDPNKGVVDPHTGMLLKPVTRLQDYTDVLGGTFQSATARGDGWTNPKGALEDEGDPAIFSGPGTGTGANSWLFLQMDFQTQWGGNNNSPVGALNILHASFNAWAAKAATQSSTDPTVLEVCITADGSTCATAILEAPLRECKGKCGDKKYRFFLGDPPPPVSGPPLANWSRGFAIPPINANDLAGRTGTVTRKGNEVSVTGGLPFNRKWGAGTQIKIGGKTYTIQQVNHEASVTLASAPDGIEADVPYEVKTAGLLVRRKSPGTGTILLQFARWDVQLGVAPNSWDAGGDGEIYTSCAAVPVAGPGGEMGWHCHISGGFYWVGRESGTIIHFGRAVLPRRDGADAFPGGGLCYLGGYWDSEDPNAFYCPLVVGAGEINLIRATYRGNHEPAAYRQGMEQMVECSAGSKSCWAIENLTPKLGLSAQLRAFHPEAKNFRASVVLLKGRASKRQLYFLITPGQAANDIYGFGVIFDLDKRAIVAAIPTWKVWPSRWAALHGGGEIGDPEWVALPVSSFRGPFFVQDHTAGNGPYLSRTKSEVPKTGEPCPSRPPAAIIPAADWPSGSNCVTVAVDGEPGDPSPARHRQGTISVAGTSVKGTDTGWTSFHDGTQLRVGNALYEFHVVSATEGRIDRPVPSPVTNSTYELMLEPINHPKVGHPEHAYLQDAAEGDVFCGTPKPLDDWGFGACGYQLGKAEFFRLLKRDGNNWTFERGFRRDGVRDEFRPLPAGAYLIARPSSCLMEGTDICRTSTVYWNFVKDPMGRNADGTSLREDPKLKGGGHTVTRTEFELNAVGTDCPTIDGQSYGCYNVRRGSIVNRLEGSNFQVSSNPPFAGKTGIGIPNAVDSHPSHSLQAGTGREKQWILDGRPFNGDPVSGSAENPAKRVDGNLFVFEPDQLKRFRPRVMPSVVLCGSNPVVDVSGPGSKLTGGAGDAYRYCISNSAGECQPQSKPGQVFVNCPQINRPFCSFAGVAISVADQRDICVFDAGAHLQAITQVGFSEPDIDGHMSRILTRGLSRYKLADVFWNAKSTPDGRWLFVRTPWVDGQRYEVLAGKVPPFPSADGVKRGTYIPVPVNVAAEAGATHVVADFGYNPEFFCTSRREACVKGNGVEFSFAGENQPGVGCVSGCKVEIPAISHRVLFYRIRFLDSTGKTLKSGPVQVSAVP